MVEGKIFSELLYFLIKYILSFFQLVILFVLLCHLYLSILKHSRCIVPITSDLWCYFPPPHPCYHPLSSAQHEEAQSQRQSPDPSDSGKFVHIRCGSAAEMISFQSRGVWWSIAVTLIAVYYCVCYSHWMSFCVMRSDRVKSTVEFPNKEEKKSCFFYTISS